MSGFTPGPWKWYNNLSGEKIGISDGGKDVLYVNHSESIVIPREKDAHLIAAAPDLYESLQRLVNVSAELAPDVQDACVFADARAAIAKARGEL